jgi:hypothetical protein
VNAQRASSEDWHSRTPVILAVCLLIVLTVGISVSFGRSGSSSSSHHAAATTPTTTATPSTPTATPSSPVPGFTPPPRTHCHTKGNVITCHHQQKTPQVSAQCQQDPAAPNCVKPGDLCPARLAGVTAENRHATQFVCRNHVWTRVQKSVTSGPS